uniref:uncharacterized protein LOC120334351 isoform X4 n=1 Tax=Styela clava TaxID=7725 RepID=UPI00193A4076|nr:uncharacterized protein LOC120334351 isoform X4 [Styela clava]
MFFTKIILATLLLSAAIAFEQKCFFPEPARDFDAYKLHGTTWYTGLQTNDAVAANIKCERAGNFTETSTGFQTDFRTFKKKFQHQLYPIIVHNFSNEHIDWVAHFTFLRSAVYQESKVKDDFSMTNAYSIDENGQFNSAANSIVENVLLERDFAYISDYLNYWMAILCSAEGQWIVWIYFQTKTPSLYKYCSCLQ